MPCDESILSLLLLSNTFVATDGKVQSLLPKVRQQSFFEWGYRENLRQGDNSQANHCSLSLDAESAIMQTAM